MRAGHIPRESPDVRKKICWAKLSVGGTVNTTHNGPYLLQVRLSTVHPDTVLARTPDGSYSMLRTVAWTTVTTVRAA